ncbi:hypothetical protein C8Q76DRAFT_746914 [Earliella scabrosa]|nr:hypothetical protein C8Q76DRAFT_746914 [Earliella scabrosa]
MSDISDDDLANNYGPTTPAPAPKKARQRAGSIRPVPGPSTKPASKTVAASKKPPPRTTSAISLDDDEEEDIVMVEPAAKKPRSGEAEAAAPVKATAKKGPARGGSGVNGASKAGGPTKGKTRAEPPPKTNGTSGEAMEVDHEDVVEVDEDEPPDPPVQRGNRSGGKQTKMRSGVATAAVGRPSKTEERLAREVERLRAQLDQARESSKEIAAQRDRLAAQCEEVFHVRHTEAEQALLDYKAHYDESMKRKESLIQELTERLTKLQTPGASSSNQTFNAHFITREAADSEKRGLEDEIARLKDLVKQRDASLAGKEQQIQALRNETVALKQERDAEIERSRQLAERMPTAGPSKMTFAESKNSPVVRFYEDLTNILILSVKEEPSETWPELSEEVMQCVYTYINEEANIHFSLNFSIRNIYDRPEGYPPTERIERNKLVKKIKYTPYGLENETPDIVEGLNFFKSPFMFSDEQVPIFLKTLTDSVIAIFETDEPESQAGGVVVATG